MSGRTKPQIVLDSIDPKNSNQFIQITLGEKYYIIIYNNKPCNIIVENRDPKLWINTKRYAKTGYINRAHAQRRVNQLNKLFNTQLFKVKEMI